MSESMSAAKRRQRRIPDEFRKRNAQSCDPLQKAKMPLRACAGWSGTRFYGSVDDLSDRYRCLDAIVKGAFPNDLTATAEHLVELGRRMGYSMPDFSQPRRRGVKIEDLVRAPDPDLWLGTGYWVEASSEVGTDDATSAAAAASGAEDAQLSLIRDTSGNEHYIGPSGTLNFLSQLRRLMVSGEGTPEAQPEVVTKFTQDDTAQALEADDAPEAPGALDPATQTDGPLDGPSPASVTSVTSIAKDFTRIPTVDLDETLRGLPADETLELLVQSYFKNVHDDYPLFHRATFEDEYELYIVQARRRLHFMSQSLSQSQAQPQNRSNAVPDWGWMGCLHMIIVFGSIARPDIPGVDHSHLRRRSVAAARTLLPQFISKCTLSNVRVLVLLSLFLHNNNERNAAWNLVGTATRIAFALGLHRSDTSSSLRPLDREVRRWVFCTLYSFEQFLASSLGRPSGLQEMDVEIVPPREGFLDAGTGTDAKLVFLSLRLQAILARTRFAYARPQRRPDAEGQDAVPRPSVDDIMRSLAAWKRDVAENPSFHMPDIQTRVSLRGSGNGSSSAPLDDDEDSDAMSFDELKVVLSWKTRAQLRAVLLLHIQYHYIAIVAARPVLLREIAAARKALRDEGAARAARHVGRRRRLRAPRRAADVHGALPRRLRARQRASGLDVFYAYCAAMVLILRLLRRPPAAEGAEGAEASDQREEQVQAVIRELVLKSQSVLNRTNKSGSMTRFASVVDAFAECTSQTRGAREDGATALPGSAWSRGVSGGGVSALPRQPAALDAGQFPYGMMGTGVMGVPPGQAFSMAEPMGFGQATTYGAPNVQLDDGGFYFHPFNGSETTAPPEWGDMEMVMAGYGMPR
ncbi:fungal-specific transcription factor domain-containing protein [Verticillium dahliae]|nr:fungal-specific transcription factor domain-containing protein [Verticillium dahliae]